MGNTVGKKKKLGSASSAKWVAPELQPKKDVLSPLGRSYSMPVHNAKPKSDNYHVVALTSSTYGILKVDPSKDADERRPTRPIGRTKDGRSESHGHSHSLNFQDNLRKFDIPEIMVPKPWSDVDQLLSKFEQAAKDEKEQEQPVDPLRAVKEEEPETINMWELMEGLDDDRSPYSLLATPTPTSAAAATALAGATSPKPAAAVVKKVRNLESSLSFSAVHTVREVDADFLEGAVRSELQAAVESDTLVTGKCYDVVPSPSLPPPGSFLGRANANAGAPTAPAAAAAAAGVPVVASVASRLHGLPGKENDSSSPAVLREAALSTLTPAQLNTPPAAAHAPQPGVRDSKGRNNSSNGSSGVGSKNVNPSSRGGVGASDSSRLKQPIGDARAAIVKGNLVGRPNAMPNAKGFSSAAQQTISPPARQWGGSENAAYVSPFGFTTSSSEDSEDRGQFPLESPLFDPDLLASFEKAIEDVSEDEWYRVRRSDAGAASTSGSSSDGSDSPLRAPQSSVTVGGGPSPPSSNVSSNIHDPNFTVNSKVSVSAAVASFEGSQSPSLSPSPRSINPDTDGDNTRRMSSKVAPVDFRDLVLKKVRKEDPFEKFEQLCPPGGEARVVIYVTSLRGIRKTFEDCSHMKLVILGYHVAIDERDVSMHADFKQELKDLLGKPMPVPRLFIKGRYIGGAEEVALLHEDGTLGKLLATMPTQTSWEQCDGCGGHRFVPCSECSGSCKIITEDDEVARCTECNENGLVRCPICF